MAGHSRPKDGVASLAYVPAIHVFGALSDVRDGWTWGPHSELRDGRLCTHRIN